MFGCLSEVLGLFGFLLGAFLGFLGPKTFQHRLLFKRFLQMHILASKLSITILDSYMGSFFA